MKCTKCVNCGTNGKNALCHNPFCNCVQGYGSDHPTYMIVSDWIRHSWVKHNRLFSGNVTPELDNVLKTSGIKKDECYFTSLVKCPTIKKQEKGRNEKEGNPKKDVIDVCSEYLKEEVLRKRPKVIIALGAFAFNYFFPKLSLAEKRCQPLWYEIDLGNNEKFGCYVVGIYHIENMVFTAEFDLIINKAFEQAYNLVNNPEKTKHPQVNYKRITTINGLLNVLKRVKEVPVFAYDLEASSLNHRKAKLLSIGISWKVNTGISFPIYVKDNELCDKLLNNVAPKERRSLAATLDKNPPLKSFWGDKHNEVMEIVKQIFAVPCKKGGHNTWYDNLVLHYNGVEVNNYAFDTMIMYHLLDEERPKGLDDLSWVLTDKGGYKMEKEKYLSTSESNYANIPVDVLLDYNSGDADCTFEIYTKLKPKIIETGVAKLFAKICMPLQKELMRASITGIKVDRQYVKDTQKLLGDRIKNAEDAIKKIAEQYYTKVVIITETAQKGKDPLTKYLNISSSKDLRELLFEKMGLKSVGLTESGADATNESALIKLGRKNDIAKLIMEHRKANKLKSTYLDGMLELLDENDRIHPSFNVAGTVTGRLTSYDINIQQIPRDKTIKRMFVPEEGYVIAEADMSQNELRVVAGLSDDPEMNRIYDTDGDIHAEVASTIFKKKIDEVEKEERSIAKTINFGTIYGMGPGRLMAALDDIGIKISKTQAEHFLSEWDKKFATAVSYLNANVTRFMNHLVLTTPWGRSRHAYRKFLDNAKVASQQRESRNFMVQSFASDIVLLIIVHMAPALRKIGARMLATVHDSILIECPKDKVEELKKICKKYMWLRLPELHGHMVKSELELSEKSWGDKEKVDLESVAIN